LKFLIEDLAVVGQFENYDEDLKVVEVEAKAYLRDVSRWECIGLEAGITENTS
jgi:hypothetical protein